MEKITLENAEQYRWGNAGIGWLLANSPDITVVERQLSPGVKEIHHYHRKSWQFFYVLSGAGTMRIADSEVELSRNESIEVDAMRPHQFINTGEVPLRYLVISMPNSYEDRVEVED